MNQFINLKIKKLIEENFKVHRDLMQITADAFEAYHDLGLGNLAYTKGYNLSNSNFNPKGFMKDLVNYNTSNGDILSVLLFGSLKGGNFLFPKGETVSKFLYLQKVMNNEPEKFKLQDRIFINTYFCDMFNGGKASDIDLCLIVNDTFYEQDNNYLKDKISSIFLKYPKYYFEHFTLIPKTEFFDLLESYNDIFYSHTKMKKQNQVELKSFSITPDYLPKGLDSEIAKIHNETRANDKKRSEYQKKELIKLKNETENKVSLEMIKSSINRIERGVVSEHDFDRIRTLRQINNSSIINLNPSFGEQIAEINNYAIFSPIFRHFFKSFKMDLKNEEILKFKQFNKIHGWKLTREPDFFYYINKMDLEKYLLNNDQYLNKGE